MKLVREHIEFERGVNPKKGLRIGQSEIERKMIENAEWDYDFPKDDIVETFVYKGYPVAIIKRQWYNILNRADEYAGMSIRDITAFGNNRLTWYKRKGWAKKKITGIIDEIDFWKQYKREKIDKKGNIEESIDFEREGTPFDKLQIGKKVDLQNKAKEIFWDWYPHPSKEQIIDIIPYKSFNIKISKLLNLPYNEYQKEVYFAVADTGEPYASDPIFYDYPDTALKMGKKWLDEYIAETEDKWKSGGL